MRTTLDIEEDVLLAAKELAHQRGLTTGRIISELARQALAHEPTTTLRNGIPLFPVRPNGKPVTLELVNRLRDEAP